MAPAPRSTPFVGSPEISVDANGAKGRDHGPTAGGRTVTDGDGDGATDEDADVLIENDAVTDVLFENDAVTDADTDDDTEALREAVGDADEVGVTETVAATIERTA